MHQDSHLSTSIYMTYLQRRVEANLRCDCSGGGLWSLFVQAADERPPEGQSLGFLDA